LDRFEQVEFAYLFGSFVQEAKFEDIDVAICASSFPASPLARFKLTMKIGRALERQLHPRFEVDVRLMNEAPPWFQVEVLRTGRLVFARTEAWRVAYEAALLSRHLDYQPLRDRLTAPYVKGGGMISKQHQLMEPLQELEQVLGD
jgi:predicted nucleotidyltransferase